MESGAGEEARAFCYAQERVRQGAVHLSALAGMLAETEEDVAATFERLATKYPRSDLWSQAQAARVAAKRHRGEQDRWAAVVENPLT